MPKVARFLAATTLAFSSLFLAMPSQADWAGSNANIVNGSVQFDYRGGSASQTFTIPDNAISASVRLSVNNTIANRIGGGELADTWSVSVNDTTITGNIIETRVIELPVTGSVRLTVSGIDRGFWAGWYGPIISAPTIIYTLPTEQATPEPNWWSEEAWEGTVREITAPEGWVFASARGWYGSPTDDTCGVDVSTILQTLLVGQSSATIALDNGTFGDPCGGVVKVTRFTWSVVLATPVVEPTPTQSPEPTPQPVNTPSPQPEPQPTVLPMPTPEPTQDPAPAPEPAPAPAPEPPMPLPVETPAPLPPSKPEVPASPPPALEPNPKPEIAPTPKPEPPALADKAPSPKPIELPSEPKPSDPPPIAQLNPKTIEPEKLTQVEVQQLTEAAVSTLAMSEPGSAQYEQALDQLAVVAEADDEELPTELANIPLLGGVASAVLDNFNNLGNIGADMSPKQREEAKKQVLVSMAVSQAVMSASMVSSVSYRRGV